VLDNIRLIPLLKQYLGIKLQVVSKNS